MRRLRPAFLASLLAGIFLGSAVGQEGSTQIYAQRRAAVLTTSADASQATQTTGITPAPEQVEASFPSLRPRSPEQERGGDSEEKGSRSSKIAAPTITVASSLAVVLGLFAALVWGSRKFGNGSIHKSSIPKEVIQSLGSIPLDPRTRVTMLRCGNRIMVLAQTAGTTQTLCEITDPQEVQALTAACLGNAKHDFASTLHSIEQEKAGRGYLGREISDHPAPARRRLFASA